MRRVAPVERLHAWCLTCRATRASAQLYEEVCIAEGCSDLGCAHAPASGSPATILLLPPQFSVLNESRLPHLVRTSESLRMHALGQLHAVPLHNQQPQCHPRPGPAAHGTDTSCSCQHPEYCFPASKWQLS